jgi:hypothetical protein
VRSGLHPGGSWGCLYDPAVTYRATSAGARMDEKHDEHVAGRGRAAPGLAWYKQAHRAPLKQAMFSAVRLEMTVKTEGL